MSALRSNARQVGIGWIGIAVVIALFEVLSMTEVVPSQFFPPPHDVFAGLWEKLSQESFWQDVRRTVVQAAVGLAMSVSIAIPLGILIGVNEVLYRLTRVIVEFCRPIPSVALIPLAVLVFGTGTQMTLFLVAFASFWPVLLQTVYGVKDVDPVAIDTARIFGLSPAKRMLYVTFPSTIPYVVTGVRIASSFALLLAVTAGIVVGTPGLGQAISIAQSSSAIVPMYALIAATGLIGWGLNAALRVVERRVLRWHVSQRPQAV